MERRSFVNGSLLTLSMLSLKPGKILAQIPQSNDFIKPKALKRGDTVGVIAPGTAVTDPDEILKAKEALDYFGLKMKLGKYVLHAPKQRPTSKEKSLSSVVCPTSIPSSFFREPSTSFPPRT